MDLKKWKSKFVVTEENTPLLHKTIIIILLVGLTITGILLYMNSNTTTRLENEKNILKAHNVTLQKQYDDLSDSIISYIEDQKHYEKGIKLRDRQIEQLRKSFVQIQKDYDEEIIDIRSDSTITAFRSITDIFIQHSSK